MADPDFELDRNEWAEVVQALADSKRMQKAPQQRTGPIGPFLGRLFAHVLATGAEIESAADPRHQALRNFIDATRLR